MRKIYKNCELIATKEWMQGDHPEGEQCVFHSAYDMDNGFEIIASFREYPTCRAAIRGMKETVDKYRANPDAWRDE